MIHWIDQKGFIFQIKAVLLNLLFNKESPQKSCSEKSALHLEINE